MRAFAMTGIVTASWISTILSGSAMRATPPSARMSAGTRSRAITATAPASSAIRACSAVVTSMITPPLSMSARPLFTRIVPISAIPADSSLAVPGRRRGQSGRSAVEAAEHLVHLVLGRRHRPQEDGVLLRAHDVVDVRLQLLRSEEPEPMLDAERVVGVGAERDPDGVARMERQQAAVLRMPFDDPELRRVGRHLIALLAQAARRRLRLVGRGLALAAGSQQGQQEREGDQQPHRAATVPRRAVE